MMETSGRSAADIHTGSLSYSFQTFQNLDFICAIFVLYLLCTHSILLVFISYLSLMDIEYFIYRKTMIYKFIHTCTGNQCLYIIYTI